MYRVRERVSLDRQPYGSPPRSSLTSRFFVKSRVKALTRVGAGVDRRGVEPLLGAHVSDHHAFPSPPPCAHYATHPAPQESSENPARGGWETLSGEKLTLTWLNRGASLKQNRIMWQCRRNYDRSK